MTLFSYITYCIVNKLPHKLAWVQSILGVYEDNYLNSYIKIDRGNGYVMVNNKYVNFSNYKSKDSFVRISDTITATKELFKSLDKDYETTIGRLLINYILIEVPFNGKIPYFKDDINIGSIVNTVKDALSEDIISVEEYKKFVWSCTYLESFSRLVTPSSTPKLIAPPPGIDEYKTKLKDEFKTKYGSNWDADPSRIVEYDNKLKSYYNDFLKGDPSDGILADNKSKDNALAKKYLTFSTTNAFGDQEHIDESLSDGYPDDPKKLSAMFNTVRAASYSRGAETQRGGSVAKAVLRATSSIEISIDDCGVKYGKVYYITKDMANSLVGRYIISNNKLVKLTPDNIDDYVDKEVELRTPMYCAAKPPTLCKVCMGEKAGRYPRGIPLIVTNISSVLTLSSLKQMHNSQVSTVDIDLDKLIY